MTEDTYWRCSCGIVYKGERSPSQCLRWRDDRVHTVALVQPSDIPAARARWEGRTMEQRNGCGFPGCNDSACWGEHDYSELTRRLDDRDERMLLALASMLAWENTHALWDMDVRGEEPTPEQDYAMYRDKLLEVGRKAMEGK